ncbi:MAG: peptidoglycan-binding protein [Selenomonadaceae bacterium]|nr:peptidoglycan-binding protein [Selenomonadaceae bacterium]
MKMVRRGKNFVKSLRKKICALTLIFSSLTFNFCAAASYGESSAEVAEIQTCLTAQGLFSGAIDGYYGESTVAAIKDFQSAIGLPADGICGHVTYELLHAAAYDEIDITTLMNGGASNYIKPGDSGDKVKALQTSLIELGYLSGTADGIYSSATALAVKNFQSRNGLTVDGLCGSSTLNALKRSAPIQDVKSNYAEIGSVIKAGMEGPGVVDVQEKLIEAGYLSGSPDGYCGLATVEAIKKFQTAKGIKADGVCGIMTYSALENSQYEENLSWEEIIVDEPNYGRVIYVEATAYSSQDPGLGLYTARGNLVGHGIISVDPNVIPLGTRVYIPGYGEAVADDTGGAIVGNRIDIAFDTYEEAINFGRQNIEIYIIE